MATFFHNTLKLLNTNGSINLDSGTWKVALLTGTTSGISLDATVCGTGMTGMTELSATGYSAGGQAVSFTLATDNTNDRATVSLSPVAFVGVNGGSQVTGALFYVESGGTWGAQTALPLVLFTSSDGSGWNFTFNGGTVTFTWASNLFADIKSV